MIYFNSRTQSFFDKNKIYLKSASLYLFSSFFSAGIKILINPLLSKNLSYDDYAVIGYFNSFSILFLPLLSFLLVSYYQRSYYQISEDRRQKLANTLLISIFGIGIFVSFLILVGLYIYFKYAHVIYPLLPYAILLVYQIVFNNFLIFHQANYRLKREAKKFTMLTIVSSLMWLLFVFLFVVIIKSGAKGSMSANLLVAILIGIYSLKKTLTKLEFDINIFKDAFKFCWPLALSSLLWYFLAGIDSLMLEKLHDSNTFALYNIGLALSGFLGVLYTAISQTFEPEIYKAIAENKILKLYRIISGIVLINAIPVIIFILFAPFLTKILTAGRYTDAASFARILSLKVITTSFYYSIITVIIGFGYTKAELGLRIIGAIICVYIYSVFIKYFGFYGAAWGQVIAFLLMAIIGILFLFFKYNANKKYAKTRGITSSFNNI